MKTYIVTGCYGSGKTEFCVNLALNMQKRTESRVYIADMDILNPYFRSREKEGYLRERNIEVVGNALNNNTGQDIPAVSYSFLSLLADNCVIIDLAGSESGLKLLASCYDRITEYEMLCVVNAFRPDTDTPEKTESFVKSVNAVSKLPVTGIVNNGNMLRETEPGHILKSQETALAACRGLGIPLRYTLLSSGNYAQLTGKIVSQEIITFDRLQMRERWQ